VVKRPKIGEIEHAPEPPTRDYVKRNRLQIDTGVEVFRRFQQDFKPTGKKPVLFVMADQTRNADKVGAYLEREHRLKTLVIHTDTAGVITKKDLETAREAARSIDTNEYQAIVSVMMLKEGWDVKNVCVIIPLRSYESAILAEQTLGRGLRRMTPLTAGWEEKLIVIDHPRFRDLWNAEIENEDLDIEIIEARRVYEPANIVRVDPANTQYDFSIPVLAGGVTRDVRRIADLDIESLPRGLFRWDEITLPTVMYREKDLLTQKTDLERELSFDYTDHYEVYLANITKAILSHCAASAQFAEVVPRVRQYIEQRLFDSLIDMSDPDTVRKLNHLPVRERIRDVFADAILRLQVVEEPYELVERWSVGQWNEGQAFHTSEPVYPARKTVFAGGEREGLPHPRGSEYEKQFMRYLDAQDEVLAYTRVLPRMPLRIPYHDTQGYLRHYTPDKGRRISYAALEQLSNAFAAALLAQGVQKGERVALVVPNSPQSILAQIGAWKAGAIVAPINSLYTEHELEYVFNEIGVETVLVLTPFYAKIKAIQPRTQVRRVIATNIKEFLPPALRLLFTLAKEKKEGHRITLQPGDCWLSDLLRQHADAPRPADLPLPQDPAILLFSGGTTGTPKAALGTHQALLMSAMQLHAYARTVLHDWEDILTLVMPQFHVYGNMAMNCSLVARWPMAVVPNPRDIDDLVNTIRKVRPACLHGVPTLFIALLNHPDVISGKAGINSMRLCWSAAAPLMAETKQRFEKITGGWLLEAYGMTETILAAVCCPIHGKYKEGSVGVPLPDVDVRIVDMDTGERELPLGEIGEIIIQAPQIMHGYWQRPTETANMIRSGPKGGPGGRWVYTGDLGYMDEDGYLFIVDRKKDLIKTSGFQVWPREVEEVIATHPAVAEVSVAGVPDERQGEVGKAWIVLRQGQQVTADEIRAYCRERLTGYKVPKYIEFRDRLPKTMVGKVLRRELVREMAADAASQPDRGA